MRIAQIAPLAESVPPQLYGGTERIVSYLTEELVARGHEVTMFASGDSITKAELVPCCRRALRLDGRRQDSMLHYAILTDTVREYAEDFDVLHFHIEAVHFPLFRPMAGRALTTLHNRQDSAELQLLYRRFPEMPLVAISDAQRRAVRNGKVVATVHHGIPADLFAPVHDPRGGYVAFLGRMSPEKRPDLAIAIARALGVPLKMAAKVDIADKEYFEEIVKPLLGESGVEYIGEVTESDKQKFLGEARALLFPIDWPEPFGLVLIEAMACGTPVLAIGNGSVPEVIDSGVSGHVVNSLEAAIATLSQTMALDRAGVRRCFEKRFTAARMADDYIRVYESMLEPARAAEHEPIPIAPLAPSAAAESITLQGPWLNAATSRVADGSA
jgi:glycosyltransferase involved in cell wall biosynthesis